MADDELDDVGQTTPKGSGAAWQWRAIAQILPALLISGIRDNEQRSEPGESREEKPTGWQALLSGVLDRLATALARLESKLNAGPVVGEKQAADQLGITPETVREHAPFMGIPYVQGKNGEVTFRENHLPLAYLPEPPQGIPNTDNRPPVDTFRQEPLIRSTSPGYAASTAASTPSRGAGFAAAMPPDVTAGMAIRGVENHDSVIHRLSLAAREAFSGGQTATSTEQLAPGEAASVPAGAKVIVEVQDKADGRPSANEPADRRTFARRVMDRILPVSQAEREQARARGADAAMPQSQSRPMQFRRAIRSLSVRGKRAVRRAGATLRSWSQTKLGRSRLGAAAVQVGTRGTAVASQLLGTIGRAAAVTGTGAAAGAGAAAGVGAAATGSLAIPVIGQIIAVGAALSGVATLLKSFAQGLAESNRRLGQYNGMIAAANARLDVRRVQNDINIAAGTQGTASELADAVADMETALGPLRQDVLNVLNTLATYGARTVEMLGDIYDGITLDANERAELLIKIIDLIPGVDMTEVLAELKEMNELEKRRQKAGASPFGRQFADALRDNLQHKQQAGVQARPPIEPQWEQRGF